MPGLKKRFARIHAKNPGLPLIAIAIIYGLFMDLRILMYRLGIFRTYRMEGVRVISVGNITVGGSGKTPVAMMITRMLQEAGEKPAVVSRGYGRLSREPVQVVSDGNRLLETYPEAGDEAVMCAENLTGIPVICSPKRMKAIRTARDTYGAKAIVMDDGFSHLSVWRDKNILLVNALDPFGNAYLLPAGPLREPLSSIERADTVIITRASAVAPEKIDEIKKKVKACTARTIPFFTCDIEPVEVIEPGGARYDAKEFLNGRETSLISGIASPGQFEAMVKALGSSPVEHFSYEDHHRFNDEELKSVLDNKSKSSTLLTTEKDFIRMPGFVKKFAHRLTVSVKINEDIPGSFQKFLLS